MFNSPFQNLPGMEKWFSWKASALSAPYYLKTVFTLLLAPVILTQFDNHLEARLYNLTLAHSVGMFGLTWYLWISIYYFLLSISVVIWASILPRDNTGQNDFQRLISHLLIIFNAFYISNYQSIEYNVPHPNTVKMVF